MDDNPYEAPQVPAVTSAPPAQRQSAFPSVLWFLACCGLLLGLLTLPPYFFAHYVLVELNTGKRFSLWLLEAAARVALTVAAFFGGLWLMRRRKRANDRSAAKS